VTTRPLHTGTVCGHPVRFFRSPNNDGRPDFPWFAIDDLQKAVGLNRQARQFFLHKMRSSNWGNAARTVATDDGRVTVAPHFVAQGFLSASIDKGMATPSAETDYACAGADAMMKLTAHLQFGTDEWFWFMKAAMNRHEKADDVA
jgi:hypothetical protein